MTMFIIVILLCLFVSIANASTDTNSTQRFALISASNDGGPTRERLRYAETDALNIAKVFNEIGGVEAKNETILLSPSLSELLDVLKNFNNRINDKNNDNKKEFIFYYSGHSDDDGLLLKDGKLSYSDLKKHINNIKTDVRIALLDSCQSGAFTRTKGGKHKPPFLLNQANNINGNIILTSASASEAAQESDKIGASFFTHYLVSGLRGAADISGDKTVTLNEAYNYAFHETLNRTKKTQAGAQHPAYNMQVAGAGDLVMTDLQSLSSSIVIPKELKGRLFVYKTNGPLIAEINKSHDSSVRVALENSEYKIVYLTDSRVYESIISLLEGEIKQLELESFMLAKKESTQSRGNTKIKIDIKAFRSNVKNDVMYAGVYYHSLKLNAHNEFATKENTENYLGYAIAYQRVLVNNLSLKSYFYETKGIGVFRGGGVEFIGSLYGSNMSKRNGFKLYTGVGIFYHKLRGLSNTYQNYYETHGMKANYYLPIGVQYQIKRISIDFAYHFKKTGLKYNFEKNSADVYNSEIPRSSAFSVNAGFVF